MLWIVATGGAIGASIRYIVMGKITGLLGSSFPYATLIINVSGSLLMGLLIGILARTSVATMELRAFLAIGVLGGYTTFSSFSLDFLTLFERGDLLPAFLYIASSVVLSLAAIFAGIYLVRAF